MKRKRLMGIILSLVVAICLIAGPTVAFAAGATVDNSVDKSTTRVVGQLMITYHCSEDDFVYTVYDMKAKVDYSNPTNDYIQSLIQEAQETAERIGETMYETSEYTSISTLKPTVTNKSESSYDNRVYTWVKDDESDEGILIGGPDSGAAGNQNRHMVVTGDYARTTLYTVVVEIHVNDHLWDEGVITKEATETEAGIRTFTCEKCQETKTEAIPKLNDGPIEIKKPEYKGDIVADGMIHQFSEFYDISGLPEGTVIILNIDGETQYISVPDELQRLEVREPVEILFELELPEGYKFINNAGPDRVMYCSVRVLKAANVVDKPIYKGDITEDGLTHYISEFYDLDDLPEDTIVIVTNDDGDEIFITLSDLKSISGADPVDDSFTLSLPEGYVFTDGSTRCICPFKILASDNQDPDTAALPFTDVTKTDWSYQDIVFVYDNGFMMGTSDKTFAPQLDASRAMVITILWRLEGAPVVNYAMSFDDVASGQWFTEAIRWAQANGIVKGYSAKEFGPDDSITREQMAVIFNRYAAFKGYDVSAKADLTKFSDCGKVDEWAAENIAWANAVGLINGVSTTELDPLGSASREQTAAILHRFCDKVVE